MILILVESPTKAKTLEGFLGKEYKVMASYGHIRDLPKSELGVDVENNFEPKYVIPTKARKKVNELKKEAQNKDRVIIATDEDREGEAIAWHLLEALDLKNTSHERIVFHEITSQAIKEAVKNPRKIDQNLVNAQQARRVLDRLVGYKLSPFLWKKVARGLSAGRVQSVAVKMVVEKEKEIEKFKPEEYWNIEALLEKKDTKQELLASLVKKENKTISKTGIKTEKEKEEIVKDLDKSEYKVINVDKKETKRNPLPPFTTSTLQQDSWQRFRFPAKKTMRIAQNLYEKGFITYHRTDSLNLSQQSLISAKNFIEKDLGREYWSEFKKYKSKKGAQEAHEAIRPTSPDKNPLKLDENQFKIYDLIWRRFLASQMKPAIFDSTSIDIKANKYVFRVNGQVLKFQGFLKIYKTKIKENEVPVLQKEEILNFKKLIPSHHFTKPPARYTEATLIKALEQENIGRPSTYAPIISNIQEKNYIEKNEEKRFKPTEIGTLIINLLSLHFPKIVDVHFTAEMEKNLDEVANGKNDWQKICEDFYFPFEENLKKKYEEISKEEIAEEKTDKKCPKCKSPIIIKMGRFGKFYACSSFPKCKHAEPLEKNVLNISCPQCSKGEIVEKRTKRGKIFYACNQFPECNFALWEKPIKNEKDEIEKCPKCKSFLVIKYGRKRCSQKDCGYIDDKK